MGTKSHAVYSLRLCSRANVRKRILSQTIRKRGPELEEVEPHTKAVVGKSPALVYLKMILAKIYSLDRCACLNVMF
jgi:hypothetical protein